MSPIALPLFTSTVHAFQSICPQGQFDQAKMKQYSHRSKVIILEELRIELRTFRIQARMLSERSTN